VVSTAGAAGGDAGSGDSAALVAHETRQSLRVSSPYLCDRALDLFDGQGLLTQWMQSQA
jgi:hypothetical protein